MLCGAWVRGFSLKQNRWGRFAVDNISDVSWNAGAFDALMLPEGYKDLILSFVEAQEHGQERIFDDIVEGKGLGTIVLMAGNPGTGKTLTAEAVADYVRRPLYMLNIGELGTKAKDVESRLQMVLELTEKWNAILLFDECDVFMQKRNTDNLVHNEIVAVALR
jgi:SpoVK/Ycf46/Vps4 family AAA+-type ATPase